MDDSANPYLTGNYAPWREEGDASISRSKASCRASSTAPSTASGPTRTSSRSAATIGSTATGWSMRSSCATAAPLIAIATSAPTASRLR